MSILKKITVMVVAFSLISTPAFAHSPGVYHGDDYGTIKFNHNRLYICDLEKDGNRAYSVGRKPGGTKFTVTDPRARDGYCNSRNPSGKVAAFKVCERNKGCTNWHRA